MATRRANHAATASPAPAKRGRLSERCWADILRATRVVREEGVALRVHGIEIFNKRKPLKMKKKVPRQEQKKPTETVAPTLPSTANGDKPPPPRSKRRVLHRRPTSRRTREAAARPGRAPEAGGRIWSTRNGLNATGSRARRPSEAGASERLVRV